MFEVIIFITLLFILALVLRVIFPKLCAICFAISVFWVLGFIFHITEIYVLDLIIISLLMGGSTVGVMYYLGSKLSEEFNLFKLPLILSLIFFFYSILIWTVDLKSLYALLGLWFIFLIIFLTRNSYSKKWFKKITECCRNW